MSQFQEPPIDPLADTNPSVAIRNESFSSDQYPLKRKLPLWRRLVGYLSLLGAFLFTFATIVLLFLTFMNADESNPIPEVIGENPTIDPSQTPTEIPTLEPTNEVIEINNNNGIDLIPTLSFDVASVILQTPLVEISLNNSPLTLEQYDPFTIIPDRPRNEITQYIAVRGDTIDSISRRFNLERESIAWCNDRRIVQVLRPGDVVNIPPVDGVCHQQIGGRAISEIATQYKVDDPYQVIDSIYNNLFGTSPETVLPSGVTVFIPDGEGEVITWNPVVEREGGDGSGNSGFVTFAPGQPGSCGRQEVISGTAWGNPLPNGTFMRGYYAGHSGLDLAASTGTPVLAANTGRVIFAGWNNWGYGNTVVLVHGPFTTLYGHMSGTNVRCGDYVVVGQQVGTVGSTGNSSGPHLHFEIRFNDQPQNPSVTPGIGW